MGSEMCIRDRLLPVKPPRGAVDREFVIYRIGGGGGGRGGSGGGGGGRHQHHHQHQRRECLPGTRAQNGSVASAGVGADAGVLLRAGACPGAGVSER